MGELLLGHHRLPQGAPYVPNPLKFKRLSEFLHRKDVGKPDCSVIPRDSHFVNNLINDFPIVYTHIGTSSEFHTHVLG